MRDGVFKQLLYKTGIMPTYIGFVEWRYRGKTNNKKTYKWYFRFLKIQKNKIVFDNFLGRGYGDNPKAIAEEIIRKQLDWDLVWLTNKKENMPKQIRQVTYGTIEAMRELSTAKVWVFNCRNVKHPKKRFTQKYLQTWHGGYPLKLIEKEVEDQLDKQYVEQAKKDGTILNAIISSSEYMTKKIQKYFWLGKQAHLLEIGEPKNDVLFDDIENKFINIKIRSIYSVTEGTKIVLYLPTFRDNTKVECYNIDYEKVINAFEKKYKNPVVIFLRLHPNVLNSTNIELDLPNNVINVSDYPEASDLYCVADVLISDYSGVLLSFSLLHKPIYIYAKDLDNYTKKRGFNELYNMIPCKKCTSNDELVDEIINTDDKELTRRIHSLFNYIHPFENGTASKNAVIWIENQIKHKSPANKS